MKFALLLFFAAAAAAAPVDFVRDVRPIFEQHCAKCHGADKQKGGLRLDIKAAALKGGDSHAPNIIPGDSAKSPLVQFVSGKDEDMLMPPKGERLSAEQVATLQRWIDEGAAWPDGIDAGKFVDKRDHWAFKPLGVPALAGPPKGGTPNEPAKAGTPNGLIDSLVTAKLGENHLTMSAQADRRTLIRRLYLVLHGLPPTPAEVDAFMVDQDPQAYEKLVDRLLASPRYGEKWARHWLDVIAFGETHGFEVNTPRENAWPYRDYVIQAFNQDTPYPRFIMEQLAGDTLGIDAATGFMVASGALLPGQTGKDEESKAKARQDELNDMVSIASGAFLGLTLHCARCHDHKFDPVSQTDYYGLQAIFAGVRHGERSATLPGMKAKEKERAGLLPKLAKATHRLVRFEPLAAVGDGLAATRAPVNALRNIEHFAPVKAFKLRFTVLATSEKNRYEPCLDELEIYSTDGRNVALSTPRVNVRATVSQNSARHRVAHINDGYYGNDRSWIPTAKGGGWVQVEFGKFEEIEAVVWGRDRLGKYRDRLPVKYRIEVAGDDQKWQVIATSDDRLPFSDPKARPQLQEPANAEDVPRWHEAKGEVAALEEGLRQFVSGPMIYAGRFEQPGPSFRLYRGEAMQPREEVAPSAVEAIAPAFLKLTNQTSERERRVAFAKWLADPQNPLPARVLVNRLWQHHFGEGIVATPNDFGRNGAPPANPALLDALASEFIRGGWSIKHLQRLIVTSAAWKQRSDPRPDGLAADAQDRLIWRFPPRRADAETVRDGILAVAGSLDLRMGGPGFSVFAANSNYVRVYDPKPAFGPAEWRRMIYMTKVRMAQDATFGSFDCPDAGQSQPKRARSTTAIQALSLFNSGFVTQQADLFAERVKREAPGDSVHGAFVLAFQRPPTAEEARVCATLVQEHGLPALCRVLLNANEFLFLP